MRKNHNVQVGQLWRSSDPRRLRLIEVVTAVNAAQSSIGIRTIYPLKKGCIEFVPIRKFLVTGSKGLTRVK